MKEIEPWIVAFSWIITSKNESKKSNKTGWCRGVIVSDACFNLLLWSNRIFSATPGPTHLHNKFSRIHPESH